MINTFLEESLDFLQASRDVDHSASVNRGRIDSQEVLLGRAGEDRRAQVLLCHPDTPMGQDVGDKNLVVLVGEHKRRMAASSFCLRAFNENVNEEGTFVKQLQLCKAEALKRDAEEFNDDDRFKQLLASVVERKQLSIGRIKLYRRVQKKWRYNRGWLHVVQPKEELRWGSSVDDFDLWTLVQCGFTSKISFLQYLVGDNQELSPEMSVEEVAVAFKCMLMRQNAGDHDLQMTESKALEQRLTNEQRDEDIGGNCKDQSTTRGGREQGTTSRLTQIDLRKFEDVHAAVRKLMTHAPESVSEKTFGDKLAEVMRGLAGSVDVVFANRCSDASRHGFQAVGEFQRVCNDWQTDPENAWENLRTGKVENMVRLRRLE